jgi:hypothetical protein
LQLPEVSFLGATVLCPLLNYLARFILAHDGARKLLPFCQFVYDLKVFYQEEFLVFFEAARSLIEKLMDREMHEVFRIGSLLFTYKRNINLRYRN